MRHATKHKQVIVNADDFGWSAGITEGILRAHRDGIVTSTTVVANMPAAAEGLARLPEAPGLGVGVHLNISQGPPLSRAGAVLTDATGVMNRTATGVVVACATCPWLLRAVEAEFDAQIRFVLDHGVRPTHLDSHRHSHALPPVFAVAVRLARRYAIRFVRWHGEHLPGRGWPEAGRRERRIVAVLNTLARLNAGIGADRRGTTGTWGVAHTGRISAKWLIRAVRAVGPGVTEILTHPGLAGDLDASTTRLRESRQAELEALCDETVRRAFVERGVELIHYGQLPRRD